MLGIPNKPEVSLGMSLATIAVVYSIYNHGLPSHADERANPPGDMNLDAARKQASWTAAGVVGAISLIAKDPTVFVFGGLTIVALDWLHRVNNFTNPLTGSVLDNPFNAGDASGAAPTSEVQETYPGLQAVM